MLTQHSAMVAVQFLMCAAAAAALLQILFYVVHWAACMFYFIAKQHYFEKNTWVGAAEGPSFQDTSAVEK
jgi:hypothetical protein